MQNRKKYLVLFVFIVSAIVLFFSLKSCVRMYQVYYQFSTLIDPKNDSIFREIKKQKIFVPKRFDEQTRLYYLGKIWGYVKYYGENVEILSKMDSLLLDAIPKVIEASNKDDYTSLLKTLTLPMLDSCMENRNPFSNINDYSLIANNLSNDTLVLDDELKYHLHSIWNLHTGKYSYFVNNKRRTGNIKLMNEPSYSYFSDEKIRLLGLFRFWNVINYFYVYKNFMDESWDKVLYESISDFRNALTEEMYRQAIYRLVNKLNDTHASYPYTVDGVVTGSYRPNFRIQMIDSLFVINKMRVSEFEGENFKIGDIIVKIDNHDVYYLSDSLSQYVCGGNYWSNQQFICNSMLSRKDSTTLFTLLRENDTVIVRSKNYNVREIYDLEIEKQVNQEKEKLYKWINDTIAYLDLKSITAENFSRNYNPIMKASTIILDLRCCPSMDVVLNLTNAFVPPNSYFAYITYPDTRFPGMVRYKKSTSNMIGSKSHFKGNIIVLVNEWTRSMSEYIVMALQANPKTITVGNSSSGADGNVSFFEFPGGVKVFYSGIGIYYLDFLPTQRVGVKIDCLVEPTVESIKQKRDNAYEKAIVIAKQSDKQSSIRFK